MKYVTLRLNGTLELGVMFGAPLHHSDIVERFQPCEIIGAGFCKVVENEDEFERFKKPYTVSVFGKSHSLEIGPNEFDSFLLEMAVNTSDN